MIGLYLVDASALAEDALRQAVSAALPPARREKAAGYRQERGQLLSLAAGAALRCALDDAGQDLASLPVALGPWGKPYFPGRDRLFFNLSHSGTWAVCALSHREVGVDLEALQPVDDALIRRVCGPGEAADLLGLEPSARQDRFFRLWTAKESYGKLLGVGLGLPLRQVEINLGPPIVLRRDGAVQDVALGQWAPEGYRLTLCAPEAEEAALTVLDRDALAERFLSA